MSASANPSQLEWLLVDGSSLIFRAFYGVPDTITSPDGRPVNAVRGFLDLLARLISERKPRRLLVARDDDWRPAFRVDLLPSYKEHRVAEPVPPRLEPQFPVIMAVLAAAGIVSLGAPGFEAEDVIASVVDRVSGSIEIVSGDRDLFALVRDPDVRVLYPEGSGRFLLVDEAEIERRYGVPGRAYLDFAVLRGDPSDGLPGLPGVGSKRAADLVRRYGGVEELVDSGRLDQVQTEYLRRALQVVTPVTVVPLGDVPDGRLGELPGRVQLDRLGAEHGIEGPLRRLGEAIAGLPCSSEPVD